ncbi:unnamed protein product [Prunus armeniaca]
MALLKCLKWLSGSESPLNGVMDGVVNRFGGGARSTSSGLVRSSFESETLELGWSLGPTSSVPRARLANFFLGSQGSIPLGALPLVAATGCGPFTPICFAGRKRSGEDEGIFGEYSSGTKCAPTPITQLLQNQTLPAEARRVRYRSARYLIINGALYKRGFSLPYLRCLTPEEGTYVLREIHEGICGNHLGGRSLAHKVIRQGYFWPSLHTDA